MRSQNRQEAGIAATLTGTFLFDADGAGIFTITVENNAQKAGLVMRTGASAAGSATPATRSQAFFSHGSKNGNLKFEAVAAGTGGNVITLEITAAANQVFALVDLTSDDYRIDLKCDSSGKPIQTASEIMRAIAASVDAGAAAFRAAINTTLAPGSDGSATMERLASDATHIMAASTDFNGGTAATTTGAGEIFLADQGYEDGFPANSFGATVVTAEIDAVADGTAKSFTVVDKPTKGVKVTIVAGATGTWVAVTMVKP